MKNGFDRDELARYFIDCHTCWVCGMNSWSAFHHICGRARRFNASILNAAPVHNEQCHLKIHGRLKLRKNMVMLLEKTLRHLQNVGYILTPLDREFMEDYHDLYKEVMNS